MKFCEIKAHFLFQNVQFSTKISEIEAPFLFENEQFPAALQILNDTWQNMPEYANHLKRVVSDSVTMRDTI